MSAIPAPLFALVGATDAVTAKARTLPEKLAEIEIRRFERPSVDVTSVKDIDVTSLDPRKIQLRKPSVDVSEVAGKGLQLAARAERAYEDFVTRGEEVVARVRGRDEAPSTPVATPTQASSAATKKATKPATKPATKAAAKTTKPATKKTATSSDTSTTK